jgi:signal recognition particle subunit SEC65
MFSKKSLAEGRRIPKEKAVENPTFQVENLVEFNFRHSVPSQ